METSSVRDLTKRWIRYRLVMREGAGWIAEIEAKEREASGINNLKIDYNKKTATISM